MLPEGTFRLKGHSAYMAQVKIRQHLLSWVLDLPISKTILSTGDHLGQQTFSWREIWQ